MNLVYLKLGIFFAFFAVSIGLQWGKADREFLRAFKRGEIFSAYQYPVIVKNRWPQPPPIANWTTLKYQATEACRDLKRGCAFAHNFAVIEDGISWRRHLPSIFQMVTDLPDTDPTRDSKLSWMTWGTSVFTLCPPYECLGVVPHEWNSEWDWAGVRTMPDPTNSYFCHTDGSVSSACKLVSEGSWGNSSTPDSLSKTLAPAFLTGYSDSEKMSDTLSNLQRKLKQSAAELDLKKANKRLEEANQKLAEEVKKQNGQSDFGQVLSHQIENACIPLVGGVCANQPKP